MTTAAEKLCACPVCNNADPDKLAVETKQESNGFRYITGNTVCMKCGNIWKIYVPSEKDLLK